jgi:hypothetical protein
MELACKGRITSKELEKLYNGHISNESILCTGVCMICVIFCKLCYNKCY